MQEWFSVESKITKFHKAQLKEFDIEKSLLECLRYMNDNCINLLGVLNKDRTMVQGYISQSDILRYLVDNYNGDASFFECSL